MFYSNYKAMLPYCLKYRKKPEGKTREFQKNRKKENQCFYQTARFAIVKTQDLLKSKKQKSC